MMTPPPAMMPPPMVTPPPLLTPPPLAKADAKAGTAPPPPGVSERRQPPAPEAVLMTAFSEAGAGAAKPKRHTVRVIVLLILLLAIVGIVYLQRSRENARVPEAVRVRVLSPKPAAVYRWFPGSGTVTDHEARTLAFQSAGTLAELLPPGTAFGAGDILGKLRGAQPIEALLGRQRARVAFYEQMRDSMRAANNAVELRQAEIKLADKQRLADESLAGLAKLVLRATEPGEIVETLAKVGTPVRANVPLMRVKGRMLHGEFALSEEEIGERRQDRLLPRRGGRPRPACLQRARARRRRYRGRRRFARRAGGAPVHRLRIRKIRRPRQEAPRHAARQPRAGAGATVAPGAPPVRRGLPAARRRDRERR